MKMTIASLMVLSCVCFSFADDITVTSPDTHLSAIVKGGRDITIVIRDDATTLLTIQGPGLSIRDEEPVGVLLPSGKVRRRSQDTVIVPPVHDRLAQLPDRFNEATIPCAGGASLIVRAYDNGVAYRFTTSFKRPIIVEQEHATLAFPESTSAIYQFDKEFWTAYETPYLRSSLASIGTDGNVQLPFLASVGNGRKLLLLEADVQDFPGLWLHHAGGDTLTALHPGYPLALLEEGRSYTRGKVTVVDDHVARTRGSRAFPWRIVAVARRDADLMMNTLVYQLAEPSRVRDVSWITPGTVILDWWARRNLYGVNFISGVNTATAKYMIDFAAHYGIQYFLFDEGWTKEENLLTINPDLNMDEVLAYARGKGVKIILWAVWTTLEKQWDEAFAMFSRWKIDGIKIDFMNRDDQQMVDFYYRVAAECARRKMLVIFHGAYKPDGLQRTYPNALTREGILGFEQNAVSTFDSPEHHTLLPFLRTVPGGADYIPGTMRNAQKHEFAMVVPRPMGQGTRAHFMALCVVLESAIRMLPDSPPDYYREDDCARFITGIPVEWDDLRVLHATAGECVAVARRHGKSWYVAAITNWTARDVEIDFSFLDAGKQYTLTAFADGPNAERRGIDYARTTSTVRSGDRRTVHLTPGGGWLGKIEE